MEILDSNLDDFAAFDANDDYCNKTYPPGTDPSNNKKCKKDKLWYAKPWSVVGRKQRGLPQAEDSLIGKIVGSVSAKDVTKAAGAVKDLTAKPGSSPGAAPYDPMTPGGPGAAPVGGSGFTMSKPLMIGSVILLAGGLYLYSQQKQKSLAGYGGRRRRRRR